MRDMVAKPYSEDEKHVVQWLANRGLDCGDDPIAFLVASYEFAKEGRNALQKQNDILKDIIRAMAAATRELLIIGHELQVILKMPPNKAFERANKILDAAMEVLG